MTDTIEAVALENRAGICYDFRDESGVETASIPDHNSDWTALMAIPFPTDIDDSVKARFWSKVDVRGPDECWPWTKSLSSGYGTLKVGKNSYRSNRIAFFLSNGFIDDKLLVCHKCDNRKCCNPAHLFLGTYTDNMMDMVGKGRHNNVKKTHCPRGHEYTEATTRRVWRGNGYRRTCKVCGSMWRKIYKPRNQSQVEGTANV